MGFAEVLGLALAAAGTGVGMKASSDAQGAMNDQVKNQLAQQQGFQRQSTPIFQRSEAEDTPASVAQKLLTGQQGAANQYQVQGQRPITSIGSPLPVDQSRLQGQIQQQRQASAGGQGYQNWALQEWLKNQQANTGLGVVSNLAQQSAATNPILTQLAGQKGANLAGIGSLMSTAGNLAAVYGAVNQNNQPNLAAALKKSPTGGFPTGPSQPFV